MRKKLFSDIFLCILKHIKHATQLSQCGRTKKTLQIITKLNNEIVLLLFCFTLLVYKCKVVIKLWPLPYWIILRLFPANCVIYKVQLFFSTAHQTSTRICKTKLVKYVKYVNMSCVVYAFNIFSLFFLYFSLIVSNYFQGKMSIVMISLSDFVQFLYFLYL